MRTQFLFPLFFLTGFACKHVASPSDVKIVDGSIARNDKTQIGDLPSTLGVRIGTTCTGTRIAENVFITAAHCIKGTPKVGLISASNSLLFDNVPVSDVRIHPNYSGIGAESNLNLSDVATFSLAFRTLEEKATFDQFVTIAPINYAPVSENQSVTVAGFGCVELNLKGECIKRTDYNYMKYAKSVITDTHAFLNPSNNRYFQLASPWGYWLKPEGFIASGDSGGPVYDSGNSLIGVTASAWSHLNGTITYSNHLWLGREDVKSFVAGSLSSTGKAIYFAGSGFFRYPNGDEYTGAFARGMRNGFGEMTFKKDGRVYTGPWVDDRREGDKGKVTWPNNPTYISYEGQWKNNLAEGKGLYIYKEGGRHDGWFIAGVKNGPGTAYYSNGDSETGVWKNDQRVGEFVYTLSDGSTKKVDYGNK